MHKLLKNEYIKFSNSYIHYLSFLSMLFPLAVSVVIWALRKESFTKNNMYSWDGLINSLQLFYAIFLGGVIPSFIAVFSIYFEIQEKTLKNLLTLPYRRHQILSVKIIYSCSMIILINIVIWVLTIVSGLVLGFDSSISVILHETMKLLLPNLASILLVPMEIFITLISKSYMHGMVLSILCSIMNFAFLNKEIAYLFPWSIPSNIYLTLDGRVATNLIYPVTSAIIVFVFFLILSMNIFKNMEIQTS